MMKSFWLGVHKSFLLVIVLMLLSFGWCLKLMPNHDSLVHLQEKEAVGADKKQGIIEDMGAELQPPGSSLPDCSHACGSCFPCKRVIVSFKCSIAFAESCPIVYRCMCKGKYYHVPSN